MEYVIAAISLPILTFAKISQHIRAGFYHIHDHFVPSHRNHYHPHILGHRVLALFSVLLISIKIFVISVLSFGPIIPAFSSAITPENIVNLTNGSRKEYNLANLRLNQILSKAAQAKANDMLERGYFSHNTPDGRTPWSFVAAAGYNYVMAGENLAVNFTEAENVENAWMNSPGHKANILNKNFEEIGIGISQGQFQGHTAIFVVQMFGTPADQPMMLAQAPTEVQIADVPAPKIKTSVLGKTIQKNSEQNLNNPGNNPSTSTLQNLESAIFEDGKIVEGSIENLGQNIKISAKTSGSVVKVLAMLKDHGVMLDAKQDGHWEGLISISEYSQIGGTLKLVATDMNKKTEQKQLADFASSTTQNFNVAGAANSVTVSAFGNSFNLKDLEQRFYLAFIAILLSCLAMAIGLKRHIQHLSLVANSSFVVILACLMWMAG